MEKIAKKNKDDGLNAYTSIKIAMKFYNILSFKLEKKSDSEITICEVMRKLSVLLKEINNTLPNFYEYLYDIFECFFSENSTKWAVNYDLDLDYNDIKTNETELQLAFNSYLYFMFKILSDSLSIEDEKGNVIDYKDLELQNIPTLFEQYKKVSAYELLDLSNQLFNLFSLLNPNNYIFEFLYFLRMIFEFKGRQFKKAILQYITSSELNDLFVKTIEEPDNLEAVFIFCKDMATLIKVNKSENYIEIIELISKFSLDLNFKRDLAKLKLNQKEIEIKNTFPLNELDNKLFFENKNENEIQRFHIELSIMKKHKTSEEIQKIKRKLQTITKKKSFKKVLSEIQIKISDNEKDLAEAHKKLFDIKIGATKLEIEVEKLKIGATKLEKEVEELQIGATKLEIEIVELLIGATKLEIEVDQKKKTFENNLDTTQNRILKLDNLTKKSHKKILLY